MEVRYVLLTIIKILLSVPAVVLIEEIIRNVEGAALIKQHSDSDGNNNNNTFHHHHPLQPDENYASRIFHNLDVNQNNITGEEIRERNLEVHEIPQPSRLVVPGYILPGNIFNEGKPFYLEKDPVTGKVNFTTPGGGISDLNDYDYYDLDKSDIDRKDGPLYENHKNHGLSDVNQLTPNIHDFLNLPVKYNPEKHVYPLISSSYANTKVQGNVNKKYNHKEETYSWKPPSTTTTMRTTKKATTLTTTTTTTEKSTTTKKLSTTTKRTLSLFEQLFGDFDDMEVTPKIKGSSTTFIPSSSTTTIRTPTSTPINNKLTVTSGASGIDQIPDLSAPGEYEYEDYYENDNVAVESNNYNNPPAVVIRNVTTTTTTPKSTTSTTKRTTSTPKKTTSAPKIIKTTTRATYVYPSSSSTKLKMSSSSPTEKVTSLPLGGNHFGGGVYYTSPPLIDIRENLNREKISQIQTYDNGILRPVQSTNNVRIAPHQDTVSFVVGHHQNVQGDNDDLGGVGYQVGGFPEPPQKQKVEGSVTSVNIQPIRASETSLSIGNPLETKKVPGQVVDEKLNSEDLNKFSKNKGTKIVFPKEEKPEKNQLGNNNNKEVLSLNSKPIFHQLPSDLTPPNVNNNDRRPPWDPRPGHFFNGRPEYSRPPKPFHKYEPYKRVDTLPNILPQFRPNVKPNVHHLSKVYVRPPPPPPPHNNNNNIIHRPPPPSYFEKLIPPAPPKNLLQNLRKLPPPPRNSDLESDSISKSNFKLYNNQGNSLLGAVTLNPIAFSPKPPVMNMVANRRHGESEEIETLQMIQAKNVLETSSENINNQETTKNPVYVVYPVNTSSGGGSVNNNNKKETIVIGTRAESPLPPQEINNFSLEKLTTRDDDPVLKPQIKPNSNFPYKLEKPEIIHPEPNNQWNSLDEISTNLQIITDKPIAIAYTPTESNKYQIKAEESNKNQINNKNLENHKNLEENVPLNEPPKLDFQAPFQASVNLDSMSQGWIVVRNNEKSKIDRNDEDITTSTVDTTSEFDIENFRPQLFGGFKPLYEQGETDGSGNVNERQE